MKLSLRGLGGAIAAVLMAAPVTAVLPTLVAAPAHADAADCGCPTTELGDYVGPATPVAPVLTAAGTSAAYGARYRVQVDGTGSEARRVVHRLSDDAALLALPVHATSWGFSPDQDTFVVEEGADAAQHLHAYDLTAVDPTLEMLDEVVTGEEPHAGFDPTGRYLAYTWSGIGEGTGLMLADLGAGPGPAPILYDDLHSEAGLADPLTGWGFSPHSERFVLTYVTRAGQKEVRLLDLVDGRTIADLPVSAPDTWSFSPCGQYLGIVQPDAGGLFAMLLDLSTGRRVASLAHAGPTTATFVATASAHVVRIGGEAYEMRTNDVDQACLPTPPAGGGSGGGSGTPSEPGTPTPTTDPTPPTTDPTPKPQTHPSVPPAPRAVHATRHGHRVSLSWAPVAGATGYVVQLAGPGGRWRETGMSFRAPRRWHKVRVRIAALNPVGHSAWTALTIRL